MTRRKRPTEDEVTRERNRERIEREQAKPEFGHAHTRFRSGGFVDAWGAGPFTIEAGGKHFTFEDSDRFGPVVLNSDGDPASRQPGARSPFWNAHRHWVDGGRRLQADGKTCR